MADKLVETDEMVEDVFVDETLQDAFAEDGDELYEHLRLEVDRGQEPVRIDKYMSEHIQR